MTPKTKDKILTIQEQVEKLLTVFPDRELGTWSVRHKFNYGNPYGESIIDKVAEQR